MMALGLETAAESLRASRIEGRRATSTGSGRLLVCMPVAILLCSCSCMISSVSGTPDLHYVGAYCSTGKIDPGTSNFYSNLDVLYHNLLQGIDVNSGRWHSQSDSNNNADTAYGVATCRLPESYDDCKFCLQYLINNYFYLDVCPQDAVGGQVTLASCFIEYENYFVQ